MPIKVSFLILHYQTIDDTIQCVTSILKNIDYKNYNIVIVDNGSMNDSGKELSEKYKNLENVDIIISEKNLGFAKGNNLGLRYLKNNYNPDFVIMLNNDTLIKQSNFIEIIKNTYEKEKFHVLGPKIISLKDKRNQNPMYNILEEEREIKKIILQYKIVLVLNYMKIDNFLRIFPHKKNNDIKRNSKNYMLNGSCLIFSKDYLNNYDGLYDKTFLYAEEDILYYICKRDKLKMLYSPDLEIYHKEDSSTNSLFTSNSSKRRFVYKNRIKSLEILLNLIRNDPK